MFSSSFERFRIPINVLAYVSVAVPIHMTVHSNGLHFFWTVLFLTLLACVDRWTTESTEYTAFFFANRGGVTLTIFSLSLIMGTLLLVRAWHSGATWTNNSEIAQFTLQGALMGGMVRSVFLAMFRHLLRGKDTEVPRLLLLMTSLVLLWLFPLGHAHRIYSCFFVYGLGLGFGIQYLIRRKEHKRAEAARLGRYIVELLPSNRFLPAIEERVIRLYAKQKWHALDRLLGAQQENLTTLMALVRASSLRIKGEYPSARAIVEKELGREKHDHAYDTFLYLHKALNLADMDFREEMREALEMALQCHGDCFLSLVTKGLRIAEELSLDGNTNSDEAKEALNCIWEAMKINDKSQPKLAARIVGRAIPVTWTFLLDAYAYVLLKAGHIRFSRALLTECISEDPYFSSPYLHLAEWCIADILRSNSTRLAPSKKSQRIGRLCLAIAINLEGRRESLTKRRAKAFLRDYQHLLFGE